MNTTSDQQTAIHDSMSRETSAVHATGDISYRLNQRELEVTLDFRQLPRIKHQAIVLMEDPSLAEGSSIDLYRALPMFSVLLHRNYSGGILETLHVDSDTILVKLNQSIWNSTSTFVRDLARWMEREAGIVLVSSLS